MLSPGGATLAAGDQKTSFPAPAQATMQRRQAASQSLKTELDRAQTSEAKRAAIEKFRAEQKTLQPEPTQRESTPSRSSLETIAEMKARAGSDPAAQERIANLETRLQATESIKAKLEKLSQATPEQKATILAEIQDERTKLAQLTEKQMARQRQLDTVREKSESPSPVNLPPEMQALRSKAEERRQEIAALKEALDQATPEQRSELLRDWQQKRLADRPVAAPSPAPDAR